jgi:hypothetical protein
MQIKELLIMIFLYTLVSAVITDSAKLIGTPIVEEDFDNSC